MYAYLKIVFFSIFISIYSSLTHANYLPLTDFSQQIIAINIPSIDYYESRIVTIKVTNIGHDIWHAGLGPEFGSIFLNYCWYDSQKNKLGDFISLPLPHDIKPQQSILFKLPILLPTSVNENYILQITMLQQGVDWFDNKGGKPLILPFKIKSTKYAWQMKSLRFD